MQNIYITWHYTTHGIAYLKHLLSAFYCKKCSVTDKFITQHGISQFEMNDIFNHTLNNGFLFDKVYYLTTYQDSFDKISSRRFYYRKNIFDDNEIIRHKILDLWKEVISLKYTEQEDAMEKELAYVKNKHPEKYPVFEQLLWRDIQHYSIKSQINWFKNISNASTFYANRFEEVSFKVKDLRSSEEIAKKMQPWISRLQKKHPDTRFLINLSLGSNETQVVWHIFAEAGLLPPNTKLLLTYDDKSDRRQERFKQFNIKEVPLKLISTIQKSVTIYNSRKSKKRQLVELLFKSYWNLGFSILVTGERGIGKSKMIERFSDSGLVAINCASFDNDNKAESELFGYVKGAFTGADRNKEGLFQEANNKTLFLDEFHHLSKYVQAKLMKAMETDANNNFRIRKMGSNNIDKVNCRIIMATNRPIKDLKDKLLPDFYDRISQLIVELPPLRETPEDRIKDWQSVWKYMKFDRHTLLRIKEAPDDEKLHAWLQTLDLYGNYRDLEKIAIYYFSYLTFNEDLKTLIPQKTAFEYTKAKFDAYYLNEKSNLDAGIFSEDKTPQEMLTIFRKQMAEWAISTFEGAPNAAKKFKAMGDKTTARTLYKWKSET